MSRRKDSLGRAIGERKDNGGINRGLTEASVLVKGPSELLEQMANLATARGVPIRRIWREAAECYLTSSSPLGAEGRLRYRGPVRVATGKIDENGKVVFDGHRLLGGE